MWAQLRAQASKDESTVLHPVRAKLLACGLALSLAAAAPVVAASEWVEASHSAVRLVTAGEMETDGSKGLWAAVAIRMDEGWKTYWRNPGDAGIPPHLDWEGSINLASAKVEWPTPLRFHDGLAWSIGYEDEVVIPIRLEAENPERPVALSLRFSYAVCAEICIPEQADLNGFVRNDETDAAASKMIGRALKKVPEVLAEGASSHFASLERMGDAEGRFVEVTLKAFDGADKADLFAETTEGIGLPVPTRMNEGADAGQPGFRVYLDGVPENQKQEPLSLRLTLVWPDGAFQQDWLLD